jgi:hypothetical protein
MSSPPQDTGLDLNSSESWSIARSYASLLSPVPYSVASGVAALWAEHVRQRETPGSPTSPSVFSALRLFEKSTKLKLPIYFAATTLYPERVGEIKEDDTAKAMFQILGPGLFAAFLSLIFLHRRLNKIMDAETWANMSKEMVLNMELGFLIGSAVPKLGPAGGTIAAGIRYPAFCTLMLRTPDLFKKYRVSKRRQLDIAYEHSVWRCDHCQIAAYTLKELGLSLDLRKNAHALRQLDDDQMCELTGELATWRSALRFVDAIKHGQDLGKHANDLKLSNEELETLKGKTEELFSGQSRFGWMFRKALDKESEPSEQE